VEVESEWSEKFWMKHVTCGPVVGHHTRLTSHLAAVYAPVTRPSCIRRLTHGDRSSPNDKSECTSGGNLNYNADSKKSGAIKLADLKTLRLPLLV